jgi:hypothetical protein
MPRLWQGNDEDVGFLLLCLRLGVTKGHDHERHGCVTKDAPPATLYGDLCHTCPQKCETRTAKLFPAPADGLLYDIGIDRVMRPFGPTHVELSCYVIGMTGQSGN